MTWQPPGGDEGSAGDTPGLLCLPEDQTTRHGMLQKHFSRSLSTQGAALILRNKVSAVCGVLGSGRSRDGTESPWRG